MTEPAFCYSVPGFYASDLGERMMQRVTEELGPDASYDEKVALYGRIHDEIGEAPRLNARVELTGSESLLVAFDKTPAPSNPGGLPVIKLRLDMRRSLIALFDEHFQGAKWFNYNWLGSGRYLVRVHHGDIIENRKKVKRPKFNLAKTISEASARGASE